MKPKISPIENMFSDALVKYINSSPIVNILHTDYYNETEIIAKSKMCDIERNVNGYTFSNILDFEDLGVEYNNFNIVSLIVPQYKRLNYTVDFAIFSNEYPNVSLGIEIDGYEWHDKTKEQAARDKRRDRELLMAGLPTIHFAGTEVYSNAIVMAEESIKVYSSMVFESVYNNTSTFIEYVKYINECINTMHKEHK